MQAVILFLGSALVAVLVSVATNIGPDANVALLAAAGVLAILLVVMLLALGESRYRGRRRGAFAVVSVPRTPIPPDPDAGTETVYLPGSYVAASPIGRPRRRTTMPDVPAKPESPEQEQEREAIQRDARQIAGTYRAMAKMNGVDNTTGDVKRSMQQRIDALNDRLALHRAKWGITAGDVSAYVPDQPEARPAWLRAMVREADLVVWQMDHEAGR